MRRRGGLTAAAMATALCLAFSYTGGSMAAPVLTVADFAMQIYHGSVPREGAMLRLEQAGVRIQNPDAALTEGALAQIMTGLGVGATTRTPGVVVDPGRVGAALSLIWSSATTQTGLTSSPEGAGSRAIDLAICTPTRNIWECQSCCLAQGSPWSGCSRLCVYPVSTSSPN